MKKFDVVYAVSVTRWVVVEQVEVGDNEDSRAAEAKVRANPPPVFDSHPNVQQNVVTRVVAHPEGAPIARAKQTNVGPVSGDNI